MNKTFKKMLSLVIALAMVMAMGLTAFAEDAPTYKITITKDSTDKAAHTYGAYQIFKGNLAEENGKKTLSNIQWGDNVISATAITELQKIEAFSNLPADASAATVAKAIADANLTNDSAGAKAIADAFAAAVTSPKKTVDIAAGETSGEITGLAAGYYLVKDTAAVSGEGASTRYILKVVSNVSVTEKANVPSVTKKVKEKNDTTNATTNWQDAADYDIGDEIDYKLEGTLPSEFAVFKKYTVYKFTDELSAGLTYKADSAKVVLNTENETDITELFDISVSGQILTVSLKNGKDLRADNRFTKDSKIIVLYKATLNENAERGSEGNPNEVELEFSNNPYWNGEGTPDSGKTPKDKVIVFTYEIKALKVEPTSDAAITQEAYEALTDTDKAKYVKVGEKYQKTQELNGAGFTLYKNVNGTYEAVGKEIKNTTTFEFKGTDAGKYKLVETTVPTGYNKAEDIEIEVTATYDTDSADPKLTGLRVTPETAGFVVESTNTTTGEGADAVTTTTYSGVISGKVLNQKGATLPSTGGMGTTLFYVLGAVLVLGAGVVLISRRRMEA